MGAYRTIVADPPWQPTLGATWESRMRDKAGPQRFYDTLSVEQIIANKPDIAPVFVAGRDVDRTLAIGVVYHLKVAPCP